MNNLRKICTSLILLANNKNYYEILGLPQNCSQKDIKSSFVELSLKHHPDMKEGCDCDKEFKQILEAYNVLSRIHSRANYDLSLRGIHTVNYVTQDIVHRPYEGSENRYSAAQQHDPDNYYGIKGVKKVANWKIVLACFIFCGAGIIAQAFAISKSFTFKREKLDEQTALFNGMHKKTREEALKNDNLTNLEKMLNRMKEKNEK